SGKPAMALILGKRQGIDDPAARKGEACLPGEERNGIGFAQQQLMGAPCQEAGIEEGRDVRRSNRSVCDAAGGRLHLDQGFEEIGAAGTIANDLRLDAPRPKLGADGARNLLGAKRERAGIAGNEDPGCHERTSATISATLPASIRPITSPSSRAAG